MGRENRHEEIGERIVELISSDNRNEFRPGDVRLEDITATKEPAYGVSVWCSEEKEGMGTVARHDIGYVFQVWRVVHALGSDDVGDKSRWRVMIRDLFHRKRIGISGCELYTQVGFSDVAIPSKWLNQNISASPLTVTCYVRETRND
jgi:hypothetical protein